MFFVTIYMSFSRFVKSNWNDVSFSVRVMWFVWAQRFVFDILVPYATFLNFYQTVRVSKFPSVVLNFEVRQESVKI